MISTTANTRLSGPLSRQVRALRMTVGVLCVCVCVCSLHTGGKRRLKGRKASSPIPILNLCLETQPTHWSTIYVYGVASSWYTTCALKVSKGWSKQPLFKQKTLLAVRNYRGYPHVELGSISKVWSWLHRLTIGATPLLHNCGLQ